jgi:hypothetical protein
VGDSGSLEFDYLQLRLRAGQIERRAVERSLTEILARRATRAEGERVEKSSLSSTHGPIMPEEQQTPQGGVIHE